MISASRLDDDSRSFAELQFHSLTQIYHQSRIYRQSLVRCLVFSLVRPLVRSWPYRVAPAAGKSFGIHIICPIPCWRWYHVHPYPYLPSANKYRKTPSTSQLHILSLQMGRTVLLNKENYSSASLSSKHFGQGGNVGTLGIYSIMIINQQQLFDPCDGL